MKISMSAVWDRTAEFLSDHFGAVAGIAALTYFLPSVIGDILAPLGRTAGPGLALGLGLIWLIGAIVSVWGGLAITAMAIGPTSDAAAGRAVANRRLLPTLLMYVAMAVVFALLTLPIVFIMVANGVDLSRLSQPGALQTLSPGGGGTIALYVLVVIPLTLWLLVRHVVLTLPVAAAEYKSLGAFARAFRLSRGLTWKIIGVIVLFAIVFGVSWLAAVSAFGALFSFTFRGDGAITTASVLTAIVGALVITIFYVIATVFPAKLYLAVRERENAAGQNATGPKTTSQEPAAQAAPTA